MENTLAAINTLNRRSHTTDIRNVYRGQHFLLVLRFVQGVDLGHIKLLAEWPDACPGDPTPAPGTRRLPRGPDACPGDPTPAPGTRRLPRGPDACPGDPTPAPGTRRLPRGPDACPGDPTPAPGTRRFHLQIAWRNGISVLAVDGSTGSCFLDQMDQSVNWLVSYSHFKFFYPIPLVLC